MKRLFVSDLDGTLLRNEGRLSTFARSELTRMLDDGLNFTVASARSVHSIREILEDLPLRLPIIEFNGAFISDYPSGEHRIVNSFAPELVESLFAQLRGRGFMPFVSSFDEGEDRLYFQTLDNSGMQFYHDNRVEMKDTRLQPPTDLSQALGGQVVTLTMIDRKTPLVDLQARLHSEFSGRIASWVIENTYSPGWHWLIVNDRKASKAHAVRELAEEYGFEMEGLTVFGDHINDIPMLKEAAHAIAVANAQEELKQHATEIIGTNEEDSVVKYLIERG